MPQYRSCTYSLKPVSGNLPWKGLTLVTGKNGLLRLVKIHLELPCLCTFTRSINGCARSRTNIMPQQSAGFKTLHSDVEAMYSTNEVHSIQRPPRRTFFEVAHAIAFTMFKGRATALCMITPALLVN